MSKFELTDVTDVLLTTILDAVPASISFRDSANRFVYINQGAAEKYLLLAQSQDSSRDWSIEDFIGKSIPELFGAGVMEGTENLISKVIKTGEAISDHEFTGPLSTDSLRLSITPLLDDRNNITGAVTIAIDVTEHKEMERAIQDSDAFNQAVMANMIDALFVIDMHGTIRTANQAAEKLFGYRVDEFIGHPISDLMTDGDGQNHDDYLSNYLRTGHSKILGKGPREVLGLHKNGKTISLELNVGRIDLNGEILFVGSLRDISERKLTETALQLSQEETFGAQQRLVDAIEGIREGFALYDTERRMVLHNKTLREMYPGTVDEFDNGATFDEILRAAARSGAVVAAIGREDEWVAERLRSFGRGDQAIEQQLDDGRWVLISDQPTREGGVVSVRTDITKLKRREGELLQAQKMEALGQLTGGVAHDFNNLLAIMMGNIALLEEELGPGHALLKLTDPTLRAIDQAAELTNRMLSFARQQPLQVQAIKPSLLLSNLEPLLSRALVEGIEIEFSVLTDGWDCLADLGQLEQAMLNLAINARDAMPRGGRLRIVSENFVMPNSTKSQQPSLPPGEYALISVTDTGHGIAAADLPRIFDPFFTTKGIGKGSGLGLSMVHGFIKQSNGDITVQSEIGSGTTMSLFLPRAVERRENIGPDVPIIPVATGTNETILVVEDDEDLRTMVVRCLEKFGYDVSTAATGQGGLDELRKQGAVDLLLTDVLLPGGLNGQQAADQAALFCPDLKVLFMSGYAREAIIDQGRLRDNVRMLSKPFSPSELGKSVRDALDET
ncbi:MAG: PAS domain S-box protein [Rhodospirillaceae bacterium]|nr:PAS domain S-box protein [Rhodospirillaceae bacterium]